MLLNEIKPSAFLAEFVRLYRIVDFQFSDATLIPFKIYPPRPEHCLQFYPKDPEAVTYPGKTLTVSGKHTTLTGQHTLCNHRYVGKDFLSFQVVFQPGALYQITGIPMHELANTYLDAEDILGTGVRLVNEQLHGAHTYPEMISVAERFLLQLIKTRKKEPHPIESTGKLMLHQENTYALDSFVDHSCLSHRQFDRTFKERIGISPKQFLQIIRFDRAFRMKNRFPHLDWLTIALHCGYHDYQHLVKDYKEFTGVTPPQFFEQDKKAPERFFGDIEV